MIPPKQVGLVVAGVVLLVAEPARAQHDMSHMTGAAAATLPLGIPLSRLGSSTAWVPDSSPMRASHRAIGDWSLMLHGSMFGQYDHQNGFRGDAQLGLVDWEMATASRDAAGGLLRLNVMTSLQPLVVGPSGYPELGQTGGVFERGRLVNRQHPHDLWTELSGAYDRPLTSSIAFNAYAAAVGDPALGPVPYMHRPSGNEDPFAPLGHHWEDAAHASHGVATVGVYSRVVKLEGSMFNGREADAYRFNLDYQGARLDSYAGRLTVAPSGTMTLSAWGGYVYAHDPLDTPTGMQRYGASVMTSTEAWGGRPWWSSAVWGLNIHHHGSREHNHGTDPGKTYHVSMASLLESTVQVTPVLSVYGRVEQVQKTADDLGFLGGDAMQMFTIRSLSLGATRDIVAFGGVTAGLGARGAITLLPETLRLTYQTVTPTGWAMYLRLRVR